MKIPTAAAMSERNGKCNPCCGFTVISFTLMTRVFSLQVAPKTSDSSGSDDARLLFYYSLNESRSLLFELLLKMPLITEGVAICCRISSRTRCDCIR